MRLGLIALGSLTSVACGGNTAGLVASGACPAPTPQTLPDGEVNTEPFSFFMTSLVALQRYSNCEAGFGGDLRYGHTGPGAGLIGADQLCALIAEGSLAGAGHKPWRAFLSAAVGPEGTPVDAIDRIGAGPWYDRLGRLLAPNLSSLQASRPLGGDLTITNDLPNEDGVPNHAPDPNQGEVDNHHVLTGSDERGRLLSASTTCLDWTAAAGDADREGRPRVGLSWPRSGGRGAAHWISAMDEAGCAPSVNLIESGGPDPSEGTVGSGGGYGAFYCFSPTP